MKLKITESQAAQFWDEVTYYNSLVDKLRESLTELCRAESLGNPADFKVARMTVAIYAEELEVEMRRLIEFYRTDDPNLLEQTTNSLASSY